MDYLIVNYNDFEVIFPISIQADITSSFKWTTNACDRFQPKFNYFFYSHNPDIYIFLEICKKKCMPTLKLQSK